MKQLYLICQINSKNKLTVVQKVTALELKQIELKLLLAKKLQVEVNDWHKVHRQPQQNEQNYSEQYLAWHKLWKEFHPTITKQLDGLWLDEYLGTYEGTIVIPYTKILE